MLLIFFLERQCKNLIIKYRFQNIFLTISFNKTLPPTSPPDNVRLNHLRGTEGQDRASHRGCKNGCWCIPFATRIRNFVKSARFFWSYLSSQNSLGRLWKRRAHSGKLQISQSGRRMKSQIPNARPFAFNRRLFESRRSYEC